MIEWRSISYVALHLTNIKNGSIPHFIAVMAYFVYIKLNPWATVMQENHKERDTETNKTKS